MKSITDKSGCDRVMLCWIGKDGPSGKKCKPCYVIAKFTTFREGAMLYWARKIMSKNEMVLDLTQERFELYQKVRDLVKSTKFVKCICVEYKLSIKNEIPKQQGVIFLIS